ncbi:MAG: hypothetical protein WCR52_14210 [Bacteroidota bacterium]
MLNRTYWLTQIGFWVFYNALLWGAVIDGIALTSWLRLVFAISITCVLGTHFYHRTLIVKQIDISKWEKFMPYLLACMFITATTIEVFTISIPIVSSSLADPFPLRTSINFIFSVFFSAFSSCCPGFLGTT